MDAFGVGGTIRATFSTAGELAERHTVEVVSVVRTATEPALLVPPGVRLRALTDLRLETLERRGRSSGAVPARACAAGWPAGRAA
jgi:hypothetical protein